MFKKAAFKDAAREPDLFGDASDVDVAAPPFTDEANRLGDVGIVDCDQIG